MGVNCPFGERTDHDDSMDEAEATPAGDRELLTVSKPERQVSPDLVRALDRSLSVVSEAVLVAQAIAQAIPEVVKVVEAIAAATAPLKMPVGELSKGAVGHFEDIQAIGKPVEKAASIFGGFSNAARAGAEIAAITTVVHRYISRGARAAQSGEGTASQARQVERAVTRQIKAITEKVPTRSAQPGVISGNRGTPIGAGGRFVDVSKKFLGGNRKGPGGDFMQNINNIIGNESPIAGFWF